VPYVVEIDRHGEARAVTAREISQTPDIAVFDFPHSAVLAPAQIDCPTVMFTHNIEAEIFKRHLDVASSLLKKWLWKNQYRKMMRFESSALRQFDTVIAVSERDCSFFSSDYGVEHCRVIPTGVDTEYFRFLAPAGRREVAFCGSMDWMANADGIDWFFDHVWPSIAERVPGATMKVVGREPPSSLIKKVSGRTNSWKFTGFVDDVRDHVAGSDAFVIPLRVGGGTRIKAFEAMAMGVPVVSTSIGVEGLPLEHNKHFIAADSASQFADAVVSLLQDRELGKRLALTARELVDGKFGFRHAASVFESICVETMSRELSTATNLR
jgi:glycosyltransferase involved in cell wall biosynthesis